MSNTLFIGKVYHRFDELPSTNDWAANLLAVSANAASPDPSPESGQREPAKTKPPEGTVVRAANQTAGRGQFGSLWHSIPDENLLLSILLYPTWLEAKAQFYLSMAVALGMNDLLASLSHASLGHSIKWPNDLYWGNKKTAGILIQNSLAGSNLQSSIVGIGLNVNQISFPPDLPNATSLALVFGKKLDPDEIAERLFECLERRYLQLKSGSHAVIKASYEDHLWRRGISSRFVRNTDGLEFNGVVHGVTDKGLLRLETEQGLAEFDLKELSFVL